MLGHWWGQVISVPLGLGFQLGQFENWVLEAYEHSFIHHRHSEL